MGPNESNFNDEICSESSCTFCVSALLADGVGRARGVLVSSVDILCETNVYRYFRSYQCISKDGRLAVLLYFATGNEVTKALESYLILRVMVVYRRGNVISSLHKADHSSTCNVNIHYFTDGFTDEQQIVNSSKSLICKFTDPLSSPDDRL